MSDGKVRFDLKQVAQWDRQNEQDMKKKAQQGTKSFGKQPFKKNSVFDDDKDEGGFDHGYRDRALERRKEVNAEDAKMEEVVSKLDVEQTKYLGGDMEHTHLVKGLDYALLEKARRQKEREDELARAAEAAKEDSLTLSQIEPTTAIGAEVFRGLRKLQLLEQGGTGAHSAGGILRRTVFDFDIRPDSEVDVPLLVTRSRTDVSSGDEYINFMPDNAVMAELAALLVSGKLLTAKQRRKKQLKEEAERLAAEQERAALAQQSASRMMVDDFDIYGDDLGVAVGKYVPAGSIEEEGEGQSSSGASVGASVGAGVGAAGSGGGAGRQEDGGFYSGKGNGLFADLVPSSSSAGSVLNINGAGKQEEEADLMKPIRELLSAQAAKERAAKERILAQQQQQLAAEKHREMVIEKDEKGRLLVHRDVFATSKDKVVNVGEGGEGKEKSKKGEVFGTQGGYDLYPETATSYTQFFDSDDEAASDGEPAAKKSRLEGSGGGGASRGGHSKGSPGKAGGSEWDRPAKGGSGAGGGHKHKTGLEGLAKKSAMTPWRQQPSGGGGGGSSSAGGGGGGGGGAGGMNRAARRAAGKSN